MRAAPAPRRCHLMEMARAAKLCWRASRGEWLPRKLWRERIAVGDLVRAVCGA